MGLFGALYVCSVKSRGSPRLDTPIPQRYACNASTNQEGETPWLIWPMHIVNGTPFTVGTRFVRWIVEWERLRLSRLRKRPTTSFAGLAETFTRRWPKFGPVTQAQLKRKGLRPLSFSRSNIPGIQKPLTPPCSVIRIGCINRSTSEGAHHGRSSPLRLPHRHLAR